MNYPLTALGTSVKLAMFENCMHWGHLISSINQQNMKRRLTILVTFAVAFGATSLRPALGQDKRVFTHTVEIRPGREDALLDIFKPISEQFSSESRALSTAYTTGEILYRQQHPWRRPQRH